MSNKARVYFLANQFTATLISILVVSFLARAIGIGFAAEFSSTKVSISNCPGYLYYRLTTPYGTTVRVDDESMAPTRRLQAPKDLMAFDSRPKSDNDVVAEVDKHFHEYLLTVKQPLDEAIGRQTTRGTVRIDPTLFQAASARSVASPFELLTGSPSFASVYPAPSPVPPYQWEEDDLPAANIVAGDATVVDATTETHSTTNVGPVSEGPATVTEENRANWAEPTALLSELEVLTAPPYNSPWATSALSAVKELVATTNWSDPKLGILLAHLQVLSRPEIPPNIDPEFQTRVRQAAYSLQRRLGVWQFVHRSHLGHAGPTVLGDEQAKLRHMAIAVDGVRTKIAGSSHAETWTVFLMLDELQSLTVSADAQDTQTRRLVARRILDRMRNTSADPQIARFFNSPPLTELRTVLRVWSDEPIIVDELLLNVEQFEAKQDSQHARDVSDAWNALRWSSQETQSQLGEYLGTHYRNANVRLSVSEDFINRIMPNEQDYTQPVADTLMGAEVRGNSRAMARVRVRLLPDARRLRMRLEASGTVRADTHARKGPVTLFNRGLSHYFAEKVFLMDERGMRIGNTDAVAQANTRLNGVRTEFDGFPLLGTIVRDIARQEHDKHRFLARRLFERKVTKQAQEQIDQRVQEQVFVAQQKMREKLLEPLQALSLDPTAVEMRTTEDRAIIRCRLATDYQLAAHTARPLAAADSVMSLQIHQSAVNNLVEQLGLAGRTMKLDEMLRKVIERVDGLDESMLEEVPEGIQIRLADERPISISCKDGRVSLVLSIAELTDGAKHWRDFIVSADYAPVANGMSATLQREETIGLDGQRLRLGDRVALRAIFTKALSRHRPIPLLPPAVANHPATKGLQIGQFVVRDGWIGLAVTEADSSTPPNVAQKLQPLRR
ncbi:MAG: hypothetical protein R3E01_32115 [Pirellulaceae bacterium]|nr:hypothetical protein [Planctomycetales bacterium]